mmetsp:Transcript_10064/g.16258  ORF Transcript_10064/g.16258 Transcript_10064/m.16258 type:complete len:229 (-) Transcript_10064:42-728(-)
MGEAQAVDAACHCRIIRTRDPDLMRRDDAIVCIYYWGAKFLFLLFFGPIVAVNASCAADSKDVFCVGVKHGFSEFKLVSHDLVGNHFADDDLRCRTPHLMLECNDWCPFVGSNRNGNPPRVSICFQHSVVKNHCAALIEVFRGRSHATGIPHADAVRRKHTFGVLEDRPFVCLWLFLKVRHEGVDAQHPGLLVLVMERRTSCFLAFGARAFVHRWFRVIHVLPDILVW